MAALARLVGVAAAALTLSAPAAAFPHHPRVVSGVRTISIQSGSGVSARVTNASTIATIVRWFDALPGFRPRPCPLLAYEPATVTFVFRGPRNAFTRAVDQNPGTCSGSITYGNGLDVRYSRLADDGFVARVSRLLGVDFDPNAKTIANERAAKRDAASLLRAAVLPSGADRLSSAPAAAHGLLSIQPSSSASPEFVGRHSLWQVHEPFGTVLTFVKTHQAKVALQSGYGSSSGPGYPANKSLEFTFPAVAKRIASRQLVITVVALAHGWTGIRVDAQDIWVVARPASLKLPAGVREIDVIAPAGTFRITAAAKVAKVVRWFDGLEIVQPGVAIACPMLAGPPVRFVFRGAGSVLARAQGMYLGGVSTQCNPIEWWVRGHRETPLIGGRFLLRVQALVGARFVKPLG